MTDIVGRQVQVKAAAERIFLGEWRLLYLMAMLDREEPLRRIVGWPNDLKTADFDTYERYRERCSDPCSPTSCSDRPARLPW